MRAFLPHKYGIFSRSSAQKRLKVWGNYMQDTHGFEVRSVSTVPAAKRSPSSFPLSPFVYTAPTNLENVLPASEERRSDRRHRRQAKDNDSIGSQSTRDSTIPRSSQHSTANQDVNYHDKVALESGLPDTHCRSSRIPANSQTLVPHSLICQTTVESFDHNAYSKTKGEDRSDFLKNWINDVIMNLANADHETFRALFCLTNPQVYGYLFRKPRLLTALPALVAWNGNVKTFGIFHAQFKGHLRMRSMSYLFDATFREYYLAKKRK
eukprot:scaffold55299_cov35-Attheya_sp.AAC.1